VSNEKVKSVIFGLKMCLNDERERETEKGGERRKRERIERTGHVRGASFHSHI